MYTVNCAILGNKTRYIFSVKIDSNKQVSQLKNQIRAEAFHKHAPFAASDLRLYKVNIPVSDSDYDALMEFASPNNVELKEDQRLRRSVSKLSTVFGATGPLEETLHILVEHPGGKSFSSS